MSEKNASHESLLRWFVRFEYLYIYIIWVKKFYTNTYDNLQTFPDADLCQSLLIKMWVYLMSGLRTGVGGAADGAILIFCFLLETHPLILWVAKGNWSQRLILFGVINFVWIESCSAYIAEMQCW